MHSHRDNRQGHRVPIVDIHTPIEKILDIYSQNNAIEGILIAEGMRYRGFLNPPSLLRVIHEKNLTAARDQNPLSRLPGNTLIYEYVTAALNDDVHPYYLIYFDFDNFKPFNDHYGFRQGNRIILLFAEMLRTLARETGGMAGHIGGDDFFLGLRAEVPLDKAIAHIAALTARFSRDAESFYDTETRRCGSLEAVDRAGCKRRPLPRADLIRSQALDRIPIIEIFLEKEGPAPSYGRLALSFSGRRQSNLRAPVACILPIQNSEEP